MARKYWYLFDHYECPVCWRGKTYKSRQYTKKPKDYRKRHIWHDSYDWCLEY